MLIFKYYPDLSCGIVEILGRLILDGGPANLSESSDILIDFLVPLATKLTKYKFTEKSAQYVHGIIRQFGTTQELPQTPK